MKKKVSYSLKIALRGGLEKDIANLRKRLDK